MNHLSFIGVRTLGSSKFAEGKVFTSLSANLNEIGGTE